MPGFPDPTSFAGFVGNPQNWQSAPANAYGVTLGNFTNAYFGTQDQANAFSNAYQQSQGGGSGDGGASGGAQGVLQNYADLYAKAQQDVGSYGTTEQAQLANSYAQQQATAAQGLQSRGLGNTTIANSVQTGISQAQNLAQTNLGEQIGQYKTDTAGQFGLAGAGANLGIYQQQTGLNAQMAQEVAQINANAAAQRQQIAAQAQQQASQFNYATALAAQQYGYSSNLQAQQIGLQSQYQQQLLQLQNAAAVLHPTGSTFQPSYGPGLH